jgi:hypothetical protein
VKVLKSEIKIDWHSFATHLLEDVSTTMICTHVSRNAASGVESPLDRL